MTIIIGLIPTAVIIDGCVKQLFIVMNGIVLRKKIYAILIHADAVTF